MIREYTWGSHFGGGIGGLLALKQNGNTYSYLYDGKGNVVSVIDSLQAEAVRYRYNSFGKLVNSAGTLQQPFGFSTKRYSDTRGVNYYGYRFYNPQIERWMNRDPLGEAGGINLYEFVGGNPVSWVDSWGLTTWSCKRPLGGKPGKDQRNGPDLPGNPAYHEYNCVTTPNGKRCQSTNAPSEWPQKLKPGLPSKPSDDYYNKDACEEIDDDKDDCIEKCLEREWVKPRPLYDIGFMGTDCQEYSKDTFRKCKKQCP